MTTRKLTSDDGTVRIWEVYDDEGALIGTDEELIRPTPEFAPEVVALVAAIQSATSLADLKARVAASPDLP